MALKKIEFYRHSIEEEDIQRLNQVLHSIFLTTGPVTAEFENFFSAYTGVPHVIGLNSCTAALHLALTALGIGEGDEVITTPMTFVATVTAIMHSGAKPVFADAEADTALIDPRQIEKAITKKTKAILPVHLYGAMADMKAISALAKKHRLFVVEDAAHAIECERDGIRPGHLSDAVCYSFYATKNLTSGEGGALATRHSDIAEQVRILRLHGMNKDAVSRYSGIYKHWDVDRIGFKCNMDDIRAALLVRQIDRLDDYWNRRDKIARKYEAAFSKIEPIQLPKTSGKSARHLQTIWVDPKRRDEILHGLQERGIGVAVNYRSVHTLRYFQKTFGFKPSDFPNAHKIGNKTVSIPLYPKLTDEEADYVIEQAGQLCADRKASVL